VSNFLCDEFRLFGVALSSFYSHCGAGVSHDILFSVTLHSFLSQLQSDTQWSYWEGIKNFETKYHDYLQTQIGNPEGKSKPNKKYYDPRECMRAGEVQTVIRLEQSFADLKCQNILGLGEAKPAQNVMGPRRGGLPMELLN
jgi:fructose-bisphosphate aldolase class II